MTRRILCSRFSLGALMALLSIILPEFVRAATVEEIALMNRPDRQKILVEGAKKEGKVTWYTTLIVDQVVRPVKAAFEKEYPFIQLEFFRANSEALAQRVINEYQSKKYEADLADGTVVPTMVKRAGLMQRFSSPYLAEYPAELKDTQGFWAATNLYFFATGYNSRMVKAADVPKTYEDLANPKWKGQMMWSTSRGSGAPMFVGTILNTMGQEAGKAYLQKLRQQNIAKTTASNRQVLDLTIAGEFPLALQIFNHHAYISKSLGAPVEWQAHEPVTATMNNFGIGKYAPHPHAAMLLIDFILSERGQRVYQQSNYLPAHPKVPAKQADLKPGGGRYTRAFYINPDMQYDKGNEWVELFNSIFIK